MRCATIRSVANKRRKETQKSLEQNWVVIASLAWKGYREKGRGFLLVDEIPPQRMMYMSPGIGRPADVIENELDAWVREYDPTKEILIVVRYADLNYVLSFRLTQRPHPPVAFGLRRRILEHRK
jgi:hypothetical protein